jgi:DNA-binding PadR family transcriptional regulator
VRRKAGFLIPIEVSILEAALELRGAGQDEAHGYLLARRVKDVREADRLTAYGTLYKALTRLERAGFLASRWEDPLLAAADARPRRRFYRLTLEGEGALLDARTAAREASLRRPAAATSR